MPKILIALCLAASTALAQEAEVTQLMTHELVRTDGQEGTLLTPARFLVFFVKQKGAPISAPAD
jgi:hypothetical protein